MPKKKAVRKSKTFDERLEDAKTKVKMLELRKQMSELRTPKK